MTAPDESTTRSGSGMESVYVRYARMPMTRNPKTKTRATPWNHVFDTSILEVVRLTSACCDMAIPALESRPHSRIVAACPGHRQRPSTWATPGRQPRHVTEIVQC